MSRAITGDAGTFSVTQGLRIRTSPINRTRNTLLPQAWEKTRPDDGSSSRSACHELLSTTNPLPPSCRALAPSLRWNGPRVDILRYFLYKKGNITAHTSHLLCMRAFIAKTKRKAVTQISLSIRFFFLFILSTEHL